MDLALSPVDDEDDKLALFAETAGGEAALSALVRWHQARTSESSPRKRTRKE